MRKKRVLCIVDSYTWALFNRANALKNYYKEHDLEIKHFNDLDKVNFDSYSVIYSLNWPIHGYIHKKIKPNRKYRLVTSISSHIGRPSQASFNKLLSQYDGVSVSNKFLYDEMISNYKNLKIFYTPFGVNHRTFYPKSLPSENAKIFGWVGNHSRDVKRFKEIKSVFDKLSNMGIRLKLIHQGSGLSRNEMCDFYNTVGTVVCFSTSEGTPNPILESAACGRSIISTNVGNIPQLVLENKSISIVNSISDLKRAVIRNATNPDLIDEEGKFLRERVLNYWKWDIRAESFRPFLGL